MQYLAPAIVLAYPAAGNSLPADRVVLLFRFVPREADDAIDVTSFKATVDGIDRTTQFRVTSAEAWGTLGDTTANAAASTRVATGSHTIGARVCSARGVCGALTVVIDVRPWERTLEPMRTTSLPYATPNVISRLAIEARAQREIRSPTLTLTTETSR